MQCLDRIDARGAERRNQARQQTHRDAQSHHSDQHHRNENGGRSPTSVGEEPFRTFLLGIFATTAVLLAASRIYGVVAYTVTQRTREMGLRMALGARKSDVLRMVLRNRMGQTAAGLTIGLVGAVGVGVLLRRFLYEVSRV